MDIVLEDIATVDVSLAELYCIEPNLSRARVDYYKDFGLSALKKSLWNEFLASVQDVSFEGDLVKMIFNGSHRLRALYELGEKETNLCYQGESSKERNDLVLLFQTPTLEKKEYKQWFREHYKNEPKWIDVK